MDTAAPAGVTSTPRESETSRLRSLVEELTESKRRLSEAQALTHLGSWEWDVPTNTITWSDEMHRIFGTTQETFSGLYEDYQQLIHPDDRERSQAVISDAFATGSDFSFSHRIVRGDGATRVLESLGSAILGDEGTTVRMVGTAMDVTEQRAAVERRMGELQILLDAAESVAAARDRDTIVARVLDAAAHLFSLNAGNAPARAAFHLIEGDTATVLATHDAETPGSVGSTYPIASMPALLETAAGTAFVLTGSAGADDASAAAAAARWSGSAGVRITGGGTDAMLTVHADADRYEPAAMRLLEVMARLTELALTNAGNIAAERAHAGKMEELERVKSEFLRLASHELRGPLGVIRGYISMLQDGTFGDLPDGPRTIAIPILETKALEIHHIVEQMLDAARLEDERLHMLFGDTELVKLIHGVVTSLRPIIAANQRVIEDYSEGPVVARLDANRIGNVMTNLLGNAIKYSPDGGDIVVSLRESADGVTVAVKDSGLGVAEQDQPKLFTRFGRIVTLENSHIPGTGLGLYLSREIARRHGGDITVETQAGSGSTFTLRLPHEPADTAG